MNYQKCVLLFKKCNEMELLWCPQTCAILIKEWASLEPIRIKMRVLYCKSSNRYERQRCSVCVLGVGLGCMLCVCVCGGDIVRDKETEREFSIKVLPALSPLPHIIKQIMISNISRSRVTSINLEGSLEDVVGRHTHTHAHLLSANFFWI